MTEGHPTFATLAEYRAGLLDEEQAVALHEHLLSCPGCAARKDAISAVHSQLAKLGEVAMPDAVSERLERSLREAGSAPAAAAATTVAPPTKSRLGLASYAAAAVLILLVGGLVLGASHFGQRHAKASSSSSSSAAAGPSLPAHFPITASGRTYTRANVAAFVPAIVAAHALAATGYSGVTGGNAGALAPAASPLGSGAAAASSAFGPEQTLLDSLLRSRSSLLACDRVVSAGAGQLLVPLAVDLGTWDGQPAAIIVLPVPGQPKSADVFVEGAGCAAGHDATLYYLRVARPPGS